MSSERQIRCCVSLPRETLARVDRLAAHLGLSRSAAVDASLRYVTKFPIESNDGVVVHVRGGLDPAQECPHG